MEFGVLDGKIELVEERICSGFSNAFIALLMCCDKHEEK